MSSISGRDSALQMTRVRLLALDCGRRLIEQPVNDREQQREKKNSRAIVSTPNLAAATPTSPGTTERPTAEAAIWNPTAFAAWAEPTRAGCQRQSATERSGRTRRPRAGGLLRSRPAAAFSPDQRNTERRRDQSAARSMARTGTTPPATAASSRPAVMPPQ